MAVLGATNLTGCNSIPDFIQAGARMIFEQTSAPPSWTKQVTHNNKALRVVTGTATPGGSTAFSSVFASRPVTGSVSVSVSGGSVGNHTLTTPQIPSHTHTTTQRSSQRSTGPQASDGIVKYVTTIDTNTGSTGSNGAHSHPFSVGSASGSFSGTALDFAVQYVDIIICSKN